MEPNETRDYVVKKNKQPLINFSKRIEEGTTRENRERETMMSMFQASDISKI